MKVLSKEEFCNVIESLKREDDFVSTLNDTFHRYNKDIQIYTTSLEDIVIKLLQTMFQDEEGEWISYWCYELKFGERYENGTIKEMNGTVIPLRTSDELYDFLIKNIENKEV